MLKRLVKQSNDADLMIELHHAFNMNYGWIPLEEFKNLPIPTVIKMADMLEKSMREMNKKIKKGR